MRSVYAWSPVTAVPLISHLPMIRKLKRSTVPPKPSWTIWLPTWRASNRMLSSGFLPIALRLILYIPVFHPYVTFISQIVPRLVPWLQSTLFVLFIKNSNRTFRSIHSPEGAAFLPSALYRDNKLVVYRTAYSTPLGLWCRKRLQWPILRLSIARLLIVELDGDRVDTMAFIR